MKNKNENFEKKKEYFKKIWKIIKKNKLKNKKTLKSLKKVEKSRGFGQMVRLGESMLGNTSYKTEIVKKPMT